MAVAGGKPKADRSQVRHRVAPVHDWTEVDDVPYAGPRPALPPRFAVTDEGKSIRTAWPAATKRWWEVVSRMPHCSQWTESDWQFALDTAEVHARFVGGTNATELRIREKLLGTTLDARRDLRIRYVAPSPATQAEAERPVAKVVQMNDFRELYG